MFCVAAEIPLHGLSSSFPFSFSLAILLLSNQLAQAGRHSHRPAPPRQCQPSGRGPGVPPQPGIPPGAEGAAPRLSPTGTHHGGRAGLTSGTPIFAGFRAKPKQVFPLRAHTRAHTHTISSSNLLPQGAVKGRSAGKVAKTPNSGRKRVWNRG